MEVVKRHGCLWEKKKSQFKFIMLTIANLSLVIYFMIHIQNKNPTINWQWADTQRIVYEDKALFFSGHSWLRVPQTKGELASVRILGTADYSVTQALFQDLRGLGKCFTYWFIFTELNGRRSIACVSVINRNYGTKSKFCHAHSPPIQHAGSLTRVSVNGLLSSTLIQNAQGKMSYLKVIKYFNL